MTSLTGTACHVCGQVDLILYKLPGLSLFLLRIDHCKERVLIHHVQGNYFPQYVACPLIFFK